jgi:hypothetical protein
MNDTKPSSPIEVWLTQKNLEITCLEVHEDETTEERDVDSLSMRGAQREKTGWYISRGYVPVGRWEATEAGQAETYRRFKPAADDELAVSVLAFLKQQAPEPYSVSNLLKGLDQPVKLWSKVMAACQQGVLDGALKVVREHPRSFAWKGEAETA